MQVYGVDLTAWWQARRWRDLLDLIDQMPPASRTREAIFNDDANADALLDAELAQPDEPFRPPMRSYDLSTFLLLRISNQLTAVLGADEFLEGPRTAVDTARDRRRSAEALDIIRMATPALAHYFEP
ncbi:hypothetical protein [Janibacter sp. GS2]|uniref:hypothetical protein n=1 Tax=Janibacter sp. GS2 TaxID=3442646 RepID=UPI003EC0E6C2